MRPQGFATALYGWMERYKRDGVEWDWRRIYGDCAEAGVEAVETNPDDGRLAILRSLGLRVSASYVGLPLMLGYDALDVETAVMPAAERLARAGGTDLILNSDAPDWSVPVNKTTDDTERQGETLSRIAERVSSLGLAVSLHNHAANFADAQADLDSVVRYADPAVGLCVDIGWAHTAGHDPVAWLRDHPERIRGFHLRNQRDGVPTEELADGEIDIGALIEAAPGYTGWLTLELWHPGSMQPARSMIEDTRRSVDYLKELLAR